MATKVLIIASPAEPFASSADPALKPNQPTQSSPVPMPVITSECGAIGSFGYPMRLPRISAATSAETPALMWTTVPPAKSSAPALKK